MKRLLALIVMLALCGGLGACSSGGVSSESDSVFEEDSMGNSVRTSRSGSTIFADSIPYSVKYNDTTISLTDVRAYQDFSNSYYSYSLYTITTLDVSNLDEAELHWLRESDLDVSMYITNEDNEYDFDSMSLLGSLLLSDSDELMFVHISSFYKDNRYDFSGSEVSAVISIEQEETYEYTNDEGEVSNLNKSARVHYTTILSPELDSAETIEQPLYDHMVEWLEKKADLYR